MKKSFFALPACFVTTQSVSRFCSDNGIESKEDKQDFIDKLTKVTKCQKAVVKYRDSMEFKVYLGIGISYKYDMLPSFYWGQEFTVFDSHGNKLRVVFTEGALKWQK
jgi:hypothetical protein